MVAPPYRRLALLYGGLVLYGVAAALMVRASLGLDPWDVFHQGVARHVPLSFGTVIVAVGAIVLLLWIPLRQRPGLGTISNVIVLGPSADLALTIISAPSALHVRVLLLAAGIVLTAIATGMYISAGFGPGPRDGLMTGFAARTGRSIRLVRTTIEPLRSRSAGFSGDRLG